MNEKKAKHCKNAGPTSKNDQEEAQSSIFQFDLLTINDRKSSYFETDMLSCEKQESCCFPIFCKTTSHPCKKSKMPQTKGKTIYKKEKELEEDSKIAVNRKRRIHYLQRKVQDLEKELASVRRNQHYCLECRQKLPDFYRERISEIILPELDPSVAGDFQKRRHSKQTVQFQQIDFHSPLMQTQEMEEKMWIFLGTMLIAMGSKIMDFDGTINTFRVLKHSVDRIRREVQKGQKSLGMDFFCCKQELNQNGQLIDGVNFDPFFSGKQEAGLNSFHLQGVKMESVEQYELFYDYKYNFRIKYDALLTIMQYARDHCMVS